MTPLLSRGLLLNRQFLLARLRRAFIQDSPTPGGSLRFAHRGLISFTPPACKPAARKGCEDISPGLSEAIPGVIAIIYTLKACEEIPVEQQAQQEEGWLHDSKKSRSLISSWQTGWCGPGIS
jgi:hypothetical protein